ncbi:MAG: translation initiation factor IF-2 [Candidatus Pacebacteria bacterium]|nr:translation initiation factor IF-2 [Candidatus Paceibacterota bacterium]
MTNTQDNTTVERPPIIVIMGHIDHGKSALLDYIRKSNVVEGEAGGITQHTSAYEVEHTTKEGDIKKITFLDTPGHEAFSDMRSRGAVVADIAILVVSAEDGVKTQTLEALRAIKDADIPYIIAINKIDKPGADIEKTKNSLSENEIYIEGYGGDIPVQPISAKTGKGIPEILDMMLLVAEMAELKGETGKRAEGIVIESKVDPQKGISATLIITNGKLERGMYVVAEDAVAPVRIFENFLGKTINEAQFSSPVTIIGWNKIPSVGSSFVSFSKKKDAELCATAFKPAEKKAFEIDIATNNKELFCIPLILKADVAGTLDAVKHEIEKIQLERTLLKVIQTGVGAITEKDIKMASGTKDAIIIGFNVNTDSQARSAAEQGDITIETFNIIYKMAEWLEEEAKKRTPKVQVEETTGKVKVIRIFSQQRNIQVLGGKVLEGKIETGVSVRIIRRENLIGEGKILELQSQKVKISEVKEDTEFGAQIESKINIAEGDVLEPYTMVTK